jgi:hypothetical protein
MRRWCRLALLVMLDPSLSLETTGQASARPEAGATISGQSVLNSTSHGPSRGLRRDGFPTPNQGFND